MDYYYQDIVLCPNQSDPRSVPLPRITPLEGVVPWRWKEGPWPVKELKKPEWIPDYMK
jgi:hypothetical protein